MTNFKPAILSKKEYADSLKSLISDAEGGNLKKVQQVYADPVGIPTVGAGYALAVRGKDGKAHMRSREDINKALKHATGKENQLKPEEHKKLQEAVDALNKDHDFNNKFESILNAEDGAKSKLSPEYKEKVDDANKTLKQYTDSVRKSNQQKAKEIINNNKPKFTLDKSNGDVDRLTMLEAEKARGQVASEISDAAKKKGWSEKETNEFLEQVGNSKEMVALTSLKYNMGVKMPKTIDAMLDGDRAKMYYEIKYNSNGGKDSRKGLANRRAAEAELLEENGGTSEWNNAQNVYAEHKDEIEKYEKEFPSAFGEDRKKYKEIAAENNQYRGDEIADHMSESKNPFRKDECAQEEDGAPSGSDDGVPLWDKVQERNFDDPIHKQDHQITESELLDLRKRAYNTPSSHPAGKLLNNKISNIFNLHYSGMAKKDATGRMIQPEANPPFPKESSAAITKDGLDLKQSFADIANKIEKSEDKVSKTKNLQNSINQDAHNMGLVPLKEDGVFGSKTAGALTKGLSGIGTSVYAKLFS
ncbi:MAG: hypothetical protein GY804_03510 [Alphaproteobacteria bacterium]|nr:hypothetical protein [Alphaproteobacteria bacterium]